MGKLAEQITMGWLEANRAVNRIAARVRGEDGYKMAVHESRRDIHDIHRYGRAGTGLDTLLLRLDYARAYGMAHKQMAERGNLQAVDVMLRPYVGMPMERAMTDYQVSLFGFAAPIKALGEEGRKRLAEMHGQGELIPLSSESRGGL